MDKQALAMKVPLIAITRKQKAYKEIARLLQQAKAQKARHQRYATKAREGTFLFRGGRERKARGAADTYRQLRDLAAEKASIYERTFGPGKIRGSYRETRAKAAGFDERAEKLADFIKGARVRSSFVKSVGALLSGGVKKGKRLDFMKAVAKRHPGATIATGLGVGYVGSRMLGGGGGTNVTKF